MPHQHDESSREILDELHHLRHQIHELKNIMASYQDALKAFIDQQNRFNTAVSDGIDAATVALTGIQGDVKNLNDQIAALQASNGTVTPEDQAIIDAAQVAGNALNAKTTAFTTAIQALDDLTPPVVPPVVPAAK